MPMPTDNPKGGKSSESSIPAGTSKFPVEQSKSNLLVTNATPHDCTSVTTGTTDAEEDDFSEFKSGVIPMSNDLLDKTMAPQLVVDSSTDKYAVFRSLAPSAISQSSETAAVQPTAFAPHIVKPVSDIGQDNHVNSHLVLEPAGFTRSHSQGDKLSSAFLVTKSISADPDKMISQQLSSLFSGSLHVTSASSNAGVSPDTSRPQSPGTESVRSSSHEPSLRSLELKTMGGSFTQVNSPEEMATNGIGLHSSAYLCLA